MEIHLSFTLVFLGVLSNYECSTFPRASDYASAEEVIRDVFLDQVTNELRIEEPSIWQEGKPKPVAHVSFRNKINTTGWSFLKIRTNGFYPDAIQARAAGFAEGYVTGHLMAMQYENMGKGICDNDPDYCNRLMKFLTTNREWIDSKIKGPHKDPAEKSYWHHIDLVYRQADGIAEGYNNNPASHPLPEIAIQMLLIFGDEGSLETVLQAEKLSLRARMGHCSALVKVLPDLSDLFVSHTTWVNYPAMLRVMKNYDFKYRTFTGKGAVPIAAEKVVFSSYPGSIASIDDYNMMSSGLVSLETSIISFKEDYLHSVVAENVLEWARSVVANRLAYNGNEWTHLMSMYNSGTYNNQWMVVDYNRFTPGKPIRTDTLWIIESLTGVVEMADVSHVVQKQGYWASYNSAYFSLIYNMTGAREAQSKVGPLASYTQNPRALIFKRDQKQVTDMKSFFKLMRYNDFKHDPLSRCNCTPPYTAFYAIAARSDLNEEHGVYPNDFVKYMAQGATDCKATSFERTKSLEPVVVSSPTYDQQPPFQWSKTTWKRPAGHPDLWKFDVMTTDWDNL